MPWLVKSEPDVYSIQDLERDGRTCWDGVRNYQARNIMRDDMEIGDDVLFYHSNCDPPGVVGRARVCASAYPDHTQFDPESPYFDAKSDPDEPRWRMVDVEFVEAFDTVMPLARLREDPALVGMALLQKGQRLSVQPVTDDEFERVVALATGASPITK